MKLVNPVTLSISLVSKGTRLTVVNSEKGSRVVSIFLVLARNILAEEV